ncbi:hypothetical protein JYG30_25495 (plasmid) [Fibrella sp. USSR17]
MSQSFSISQTNTFTITHARHMAAKVATDLKRLQRLYGTPSDSSITNFESEIVELLKGGYLKEVTYGFMRDEKWIEPTLRYTAQDLAGNSANDDDPGRIRPGANTTGASFYSFLVYNQAWHNLSSAAQQNVKEKLPFQRGFADEPSINGYLSNDRTYSSGGQALNRSSVKSY